MPRSKACADVPEPRVIDVEKRREATFTVEFFRNADYQIIENMIWNDDNEKILNNIALSRVSLNKRDFDELKRKLAKYGYLLSKS